MGDADGQKKNQTATAQANKIKKIQNKKNKKHRRIKKKNKYITVTSKIMTNTINLVIIPQSQMQG